jgi:hypothetical protein
VERLRLFGEALGAIGTIILGLFVLLLLGGCVALFWS